MLKIYVVDSSAQARNRVAQKVSDMLRSDSSELEVLPTSTVKPVSVQELKFQPTPDLVIIGPDALREELTVVSQVKEILAKNTPILALVPEALDSLSYTEQLARLGAKDSISEDEPLKTFVRKIIFLTRSVERDENEGGEFIVVDSAKGGAGVTSVVAALGENLALKGKKVLLVDFDFESQDLSRFLSAKPYVNEVLEELVSSKSIISDETVAQACVKVFSDLELYVMPPLSLSDDLYGANSQISRQLMSVFKIADELFDVIIVDKGSSVGPLLRTLHKLCDKLLFVVTGDPAGLAASADSIQRTLRSLSQGVPLFIVENGTYHPSIKSKILKEELLQTVQSGLVKWSKGVIPYVKEASRWPASGMTLCTIGKKRISAPLDEVLSDLKVKGAIKNAAAASTPSKTILSYFVKEKQLQKISSTVRLAGKGRKLLPQPEETSERKEEKAPLFVEEVSAEERKESPKIKGVEDELSSLVSGPTFTS